MRRAGFPIPLMLPLIIVGSAKACKLTSRAAGGARHDRITNTKKKQRDAAATTTAVAVMRGRSSSPPRAAHAAGSLVLRADPFAWAAATPADDQRLLLRARSSPRAPGGLPRS